MSASLPPSEAEWLEPDGLGGFASGTVSGVRTRRYHRLAGTGDNSVGWTHVSGERVRSLGRTSRHHARYFHPTV
jgi:hypothetical protein